MLLALQRKCANADEDNREHLEDKFKHCKMHKNEPATSYLTLQNMAHKAKQAGAFISEERFLKVLLYQMKQHPLYKTKAESLETRMQLDDKPIPIPTLEQIFFAFDSIQARLTDRPTTMKSSPNQKSSYLLNDKTTARSRNFRISHKPTWLPLPHKGEKRGKSPKHTSFVSTVIRKVMTTLPAQTKRMENHPPSLNGYTLQHVIDAVN